MKATLEQLRMFKAVVEHGGYAQAAGAIYKSQSTISYAVHKLQEQLGVRLLEVEGRKAVLTEHGKVILQRANQLLEQAEDLGKVAQSLSDGIEAKVCVALDIIYPYDTLFQILEEFSTSFPSTRIELEEHVLSGGIEMLEEGSIDLLITTRIPDGWAGQQIYHTRFIPVSATNHPLQQLNRNLNYADLTQHRQVVVRDSSRKQRIDAGWLGANQRWTVTHSSTSLNILRRGLGFAWMPESWVANDLAAGTLKILAITPDNIRQVDLYLIEAHAETMGPATQFLAQLFLQAKHQQHCP